MPEVPAPKVNRGKYGPDFFYTRRGIKPSEIRVVSHYLNEQAGLWDSAVALGYKSENPAARRMLYVAKKSFRFIPKS